VGRFRDTATGKRQISALYVAGDVVELEAVIHPTGRAALQALSAVTMDAFPVADLRALAERHPGFARSLWRHCTLQSALLEERLVDLGRRDAQGRLARLLCEMAVRILGAPGDGVFRLPLSQEQLASVTAMTPIHLNRTLKALRKAGLVATRGQEIRIIDWAALAALAEFDDHYLNSQRPHP
jgi:CRP-like cAMP-binding protein